MAGSKGAGCDWETNQHRGGAYRCSRLNPEGSCPPSKLLLPSHEGTRDTLSLGLLGAQGARAVELRV